MQVSAIPTLRQIPVRVMSTPNMNEVVTGNNSIVVIDDKDTITKNIEKTVKVDKTIINADISKLEEGQSLIVEELTKLRKSFNNQFNKLLKILETKGLE